MSAPPSSLHAACARTGGARRIALLAALPAACTWGLATGCVLSGFDKAPGGSLSGGTVGAGGTPAGGSTGTGGTPSAGGEGSGGISSAGTGGTVTTRELDLIDDMEDGDTDILTGKGREGAWYNANDGTRWGASQSPEPFSMSLIPGGRDGSHYAAHTWGQGFAQWVSIGVNVQQQGGGAYDASAYAGLALWARSEPGANGRLRVEVVDVNTNPDGGICQAIPGQCWNGLGTSVNVSSDWTLYELPFSGMVQETSTGLTSVETSAIFMITFGLAAPDGFDMWIDDLAFYR